eukprot:TRINITY_DN5974_c0_g1_i1.p2 TRINITY_DN5974_c0_g1~~TRINITY_DN5974_c0_g1_i1.p2  ORF type:complete len:239 (+),score=34.80 TRINITY_DN5974_c0_g1_i1:136-852(+)
MESSAQPSTPQLQRSRTVSAHAVWFSEPRRASSWVDEDPLAQGRGDCGGGGSYRCDATMESQPLTPQQQRIRAEHVPTHAAWFSEPRHGSTCWTCSDEPYTLPAHAWTPSDEQWASAQRHRAIPDADDAPPLLEFDSDHEKDEVVCRAAAAAAAGAADAAPAAALHEPSRQSCLRRARRRPSATPSVALGRGPADGHPPGPPRRRAPTVGAAWVSGATGRRLTAPLVRVGGGGRRWAS